MAQKPFRYDFDLWVGADQSIQFRLTRDDQGTAFPINGMRLIFVARSGFQPTSGVILKRDLTIVDGDDGLCQIDFTTAETQTFATHSERVYEIMRLSESKTLPLGFGFIHLEGGASAGLTL
ncbi:MAG: hypothetical protein AAFO77_00710 [Pseudomonadota bacterium]